MRVEGNRSHQQSFLIRHKRPVKNVTGIMLLIVGFAYFPINLNVFGRFPEVLSYLLTFYTVGLMGNLYKSSTQSASHKVFLFAFVLNLIGLNIRIGLEYGEASMVNALTPTNVLVYILFVPALFWMGSCIKEIQLVKYDGE